MTPMARIVLVHWKPAEAPPRIDSLRVAGFEPVLAPHPSTPEWKKICATPPDAFVIDLDRLPSHGRAVASVLRNQKSTRTVPLVFAGGLPEKVEKAREVFPDAAFSDWNHIGPAVRKAIRTGAPPAPVKPSLIGNSRASLGQKLGIRENSAVVLLGAPARFERKLEPLPDGASVQSATRSGSAALVMLFAPSSLDLARRFDLATGMLATGGKFWIAWPKRTSGVETDLTMPFIRQFALDAGWVDYKVCAIDTTWSGMLFALRK